MRVATPSGGGAPSLIATVCGTPCAEAGPRLSGMVTSRLHCASNPLPSGVGVTQLTISIGVPAKAISGTTQ